MNSEDLIADSQDAWELLSGLQVLRAHIWVGVVGRPSAGISIVLAVERQQGWLLLDALRDDDALSVDDALYFDTQVEGRRLRFECRLARIAQLDDGPAYLVTDPQLVLDQQRRASYRVRLPANGLPRAAVIDLAGVARPARVLDMSRGGLGLRVDSDSRFVPGAEVNLHVSLADFDFATDAEVRHVTRSEDGFRIGLQLLIGDPILDQKLGQAVNRMQRKVLRGR
ncbi:MAG: flagellar brake protein [Panacagrimonas sp.]